MTPVDCASASKLATKLVSKDLVDILSVAETNRNLVLEWLAELTSAQEYHRAQRDLLSEAIEDLHAALQRAGNGNVVCLKPLTERSVAHAELEETRAITQITRSASANSKLRR